MEVLVRDGLVINFRSSCSQMFFKVGILKNFANVTGKELDWSLFLINLLALRPATLLKRDFNIGMFLWNLRNFQEYLFLQNTISSSFWNLRSVRVLLFWHSEIWLVITILFTIFYCNIVTLIVCNACFKKQKFLKKSFWYNKHELINKYFAFFS